jgi:hypothetical protein
MDRPPFGVQNDRDNIPNLWLCGDRRCELRKKLQIAEQEIEDVSNVLIWYDLQAPLKSATLNAIE